LNVKNPIKPDAKITMVIAARYRQAKTCLLTLTLLISVVCLNSKIWAQEEQNYQQSIKDISQQISNLSRNLNANKSKLEAEQTQLLDTEKELNDINQKLAAAKAEMQVSLTAISELEQQQQDLAEQQEKSKQVLAALITSNYKNGTASQLKLILNQENPYAVGRLNNYQGYFSSAITERVAQLNAQIQQSAALRDHQKRKVAELQSLQQEQEFLRQNQEKQRQKREQTIKRLDGKIAAVEVKLKKLRADRARLNDLLKQLEKQKQELERIERERLEAERLAAEKARKDGKKPPKPRRRKPVKGGFLKQKGRLNCPVNIDATTEFGQRIISSGMRSEGVFYATQGSIPVKSIFRGQVLFADFLKGFGLLMIVDHGDDHISLYGHNELLYKKVGDAVDTDETISKTGTTGGLKSHGLYFEIRNNTTPVNPKTWCQ